jgi:hypothetical protein
MNVMAQGKGVMASSRRWKPSPFPSGDLPSAGGLSGEGNVEAPAENGPAGGRDWNGGNGDRGRFREGFPGFYTEGWIRSMVHR